MPITGLPFSLDLQLAYPIDSSRTDFRVNGTNVSAIASVRADIPSALSLPDRSETVQTRSDPMAIAGCTIQRRQNAPTRLDLVLALECFTLLMIFSADESPIG